MSDNKANERYQPLGTKVDLRTFVLFKKLLKKKHLKVYDALQMCVDCMVRYMSDQYNLTPELEQMMGIFEHMVGWQGAFNLADPSTEGKKHIEEAIYFVSAEGKKGMRAVLVKRPFLGDWQQDVNIQHILERTLEVLSPERYKRLRSLAVEMECHSLLELLDLMIDSATVNDLDIAEIRKGFEDCQRAENNKPLAYGERTRRKKHYSVEDTEEPVQGTIHFEPNDVPDLSELHDKDKFDIDKDAIGL